MRNLRNRNYPATGAIQDRLETAWDKVNAVYAQLASIVAVANALAEGGFDIYLEETDIDTLAKLNAILTDATLGDSGDFATAAQGILANTALQPADLDSVAKLDAFVGEAMATQAYVLSQVSGLFELMGTYDANTNTPDLTTGVGIEKAQVWVVDTAGTGFFGVNLEIGDELYALQDTPTQADHWGIVNRSIDSAAFATAAQGALADTAVQPGDNVSDLTNDAGYYNTGSQVETNYEAQPDTNKYTDAEKSKLAGIEPNATADQSAAEIRSLVDSATDSNVFTDADHTKLDGIESGAQATKVPAGGAATQVLKKVSGTDYDLHWADESGGGGGGGGMTAVIKDTGYTASADEIVMALSDIAAFTVTLPATPTGGDKVSVWDGGNNASANNILIARNGETINGVADDLNLDLDGARIDLVYDGTNSTWEYSFVSQGSSSANPMAQTLILAASDETSDLSVGTGKVTFRMPYEFTVTEVRASVGTAPTGAELQVDINAGGVSILSTILTIDAGEKTSTTALVPAVISTPSLADDSEITVDIDQVGSTVAGAGLKVALIGNRA